jgi:hypothetical protein
MRHHPIVFPSCPISPVNCRLVAVLLLLVPAGAWDTEICWQPYDLSNLLDQPLSLPRKVANGLLDWNTNYGHACQGECRREDDS